MIMNFYKLRAIFDNSLFQILLLSIFTIGIFWNGLWGGAPRADQLPYLHQISQFQNLWDVLKNSPAFHRTQSVGDYILYRPVLFLQLGLFYHFFKYDFFYWQLASLILHIMVVIGVYILFRQGRLKNTFFPLALSAFFGASFLSSELVLWNHISGYITFALFSVFGILFIVKFLKSNKMFFGICALILGILAEFTYELGTILNGIIALVLIYNHLYSTHLNSDYSRNNSLILAITFVFAVVLYPLVSMTDVFIRGVHVAPAGINLPLLSDVFLASWYALKQIGFWIGGWFFPAAYVVTAGGRAYFSGFDTSGTLFLMNFSIVICIIFLAITLIKKESIRRINISKERVFIVLCVFIFLFTYSFVIAYGRSLQRGLDYVIQLNIYYAYIACLSVAIGVALYTCVGSLSNTTSNDTHRLINSNVLGLILLSSLTVFCADSTYKLASAYRYSYSPPILDLLKSVEHFNKTRNSIKEYFVVDKSCTGNHELTWFKEVGYYRKNSGFSGDATIADVLYPEISWELNKTQLSDQNVNLSTINCTKVQTSSTLENYGPSGLTFAANPGWHAQTPVTFPQILNVDFGYTRKVKDINFLPQQGLSIRAPKHIEIEVSDNSRIWKSIYKGELNCEDNSEDWRSVALDKSVSARYMKVNVLSNCGDTNLLTLRGLRFE